MKDTTKEILNESLAALDAQRLPACKGRDSYRVARHVRRMASFSTYLLAKRHADKLVKDFCKSPL